MSKKEKLETEDFFTPEDFVNKDLLKISDVKKSVVELNYNLENRKGRPYMSRYEKARILGVRAMSISLGSRILVDYTGLDDPLAIAEKELSEGKLPIIIRRYFPDGSYEDWSSDELSLEFSTP